MKKNLFLSRAIKIFSFCLIFILLFNYSYKILSWKDGSGGYDSAMITLYNDLDEDLSDVLFLGSSHCFCSISNTQLWDEYGIGAFNMVISGQDLASTYYCMNEVLKTQTPDVVCVELYGVTFDKHAVTANIYRNTLGFKYSKNFFDVVDAIAPEDDKTDYLLKWPIIHTRYRELEKEDFIHHYPVYLGGNGGSSRIESIDELYVYQGNETLQISENNEHWLQEIINLADEKNTELVFFIVPFSTSENNHKKFRYVEQLAANYDIPVINYFEKLEEIGFDSLTDFQDNGHVNENGTKKITAHIGAYLKENYNLVDRRGNEKYKIWEENSIFLKRDIENSNIKKIYSIDEYFDTLSTLDDYTVIISTSGNHIVNEIDLSDFFKKFNIDLSFIENGGSCIISDNALIYSSNDINYNYYLDVNNGTIAVNGENGINTITINRSVYNIVDNGYNIVVYDNITGKIADCVGFNAQKQYDANR